MIRKGKFNRVSGMGALAAALMMTSLMSSTALAVDAGAANTNTTYDGVTETTQYTPKGSTTANKYVAPSPEDRCTIKYYGVDKYQVENGESEAEASKDVVVRAYHIIEGNYNRYGFLGWTETVPAIAVTKLGENGAEVFQKTEDNVSQVVVSDTLPYLDAQGKPTATETNTPNPYYNKGLVITSQNVTDLARAILTNANTRASFESIELKWDEAAKCYKTDDAEAGTYLVLVEKEDRGVIYNPVIVSNDYSNANIAQSLSNVNKVKTVQGADETIASLHGEFVDESKWYGLGVNEDNTAFVAYGSYNPWKEGTIVNSVVTGENKDKAPSEQTDYINSHSNVTYYKDVDVAGNVYTQYHGVATPSDKFIETMALRGQAYAKKSTIPVEKNISNASVPKLYTNAPTQGYSKYDDVAEGDTIQYDITTKIPFYAAGVYAEENNFMFAITDTQHEGLKAVKAANIQVFAGESNKTDAQAMVNDIITGNKDILAGMDTKPYTITINDNNSFTVSFDKDFCLAHPGMNIVVRYTTEVTKDAAKGLNGNKNEVYLEYTTAPTTPGTIPEYHRGYKFDFAVAYTFTPSAFKLAEDGTLVDNTAEGANIVTTEDETDIAKDQKATKPLAGAKFKLQRVGTHYKVDSTDSTKITKVEDGVAIAKDLDKYNAQEGTKYAENGYRTWYLTSDANGVLQFTGTDSTITDIDGIDEGIYTLQEIEAPKDYTINEKIYVIDVNPQFTADGQQFIGTDVRLAKESTNAQNKAEFTPVGMTFVDGTNYLYDNEWKLLKEYKFSEWASSESDDYDNVLANLAPASADNKLITTVNFTTENGEITGKQTDTDYLGIIDTKLTRLPSTGGIGTIVFTVGGFTLMGAAIVLAKKKKEDAE